MENGFWQIIVNNWCACRSRTASCRERLQHLSNHHNYKLQIDWVEAAKNSDHRAPSIDNDATAANVLEDGSLVKQREKSPPSGQGRKRDRHRHWERERKETRTANINMSRSRRQSRARSIQLAFCNSLSADAWAAAAAECCCWRDDLWACRMLTANDEVPV